MLNDKGTTQTQEAVLLPGKVISFSFTGPELELLNTHQIRGRFKSPDLLARHLLLLKLTTNEADEPENNTSIAVLKQMMDSLKQENESLRQSTFNGPDKTVFIPKTNDDIVRERLEAEKNAELKAKYEALVKENDETKAKYKKAKKKGNLLGTLKEIATQVTPGIANILIEKFPEHASLAANALRGTPSAQPEPQNPVRNEYTELGEFFCSIYPEDEKRDKMLSLAKHLADNPAHFDKVFNSFFQPK